MVHMRRNHWYDVSEGCVRMRNGELLELLPYVEVGTKLRYGNKLPDSLGTLIFTLSQLDKKVILR